MTVEWNAEQWKRDTFIPAVNYALAHAAIVLENQMKRGMGTGAEDTRGRVVGKATKRKNADGVFVKNWPGRGRNIYRAAAPGEYPGVRTGLLRRSINFGRSSDSQAPGLHKFRVGTRVKYGRWLETGTTRGMEARPWAMKSVRLAQDRMNREFTKAMKAGLR